MAVSNCIACDHLCNQKLSNFVKLSFEMFIFISPSNTRLFSFSQILSLHVRTSFFSIFPSASPLSLSHPFQRPRLY